jgi:threonine/homoserine/homoserine lactone efflux protein
MESILLGIVVGLFAGLIPGAFSTVVATTALERGLREGMKVSLIPVGTETFVMLVAVFVLSRLPGEALRWIGLLGGLLLLFMAWKVFRDAHRTSSLVDDVSGHGRHLLRVALFGLLAPGAWAFWFFIGAPLLLNRWHIGPLHGLAFLGSFMVCFIGSMLALAWAVASGRRYLSTAWHRRTLKGAGALLVGVGAVLIWQSWTGNFTAMVQAPEAVEERIEENRAPMASLLPVRIEAHHRGGSRNAVHDDGNHDHETHRSPDQLRIGEVPLVQPVRQVVEGADPPDPEEPHRGALPAPDP